MDIEVKSVRGREQFKKYRWAILLLISFYKLFPRKRRIKLLEKHRYMKGRFGVGVRYALLKSVAIRCGENVGISEGVFIINPQHLSIGDNVSIHPMCYLECGHNPENGLIIGSDVSIAHGTTIMDTAHSYDDLNIYIKDQPLLTIQTEICSNVWIGAKSTILAGNVVSQGCIIGAGAVVTKSTEKNGVYVGVPAQLIKKRGNNDVTFIVKGNT